MMELCVRGRMTETNFPTTMMTIVDSCSAKTWPTMIPRILLREHATLTTLPEGTKYQDYTYAIIAHKKSSYNLSEGGPTLTVEYDGVVMQTLAVPQYMIGGANVNWDYADGRYYYFFGCFRPQYGFVDTRGAGFYYVDTHVIGDKDIYDVGLCKELLDWTDGVGFNPHDQSGSGSGETYKWSG